MSDSKFPYLLENAKKQLQLVGEKLEPDTAGLRVWTDIGDAHQQKPKLTLCNYFLYKYVITAAYIM